MKILDFLNQVKTANILQEKNICFLGSDYQFLFFQRLFYFFENKKYLPAKYKNLIIESADKNEIHTSLTQTFLGEKYFYWLSDASSFKDIEYLLNYKSPHYISFYLNKEKVPKSTDNNKFIFVEIDEEIKFEDFVKITEILEIKISSQKLSIIKKIYSELNKNFTLDQIIMLINYIDLIRVDKEADVIEYIFSVLNNGLPSLNLLATYFFEKKQNEFFKIWTQVYNEYPEMFWISFWADKVYRAYFVINFLNKNDYATARSLSFGLPYSFLKGEWKKNLPNVLSNYHDFLYTNDFRVKTGSTFCFMDLFYLNHFSC